MNDTEDRAAWIEIDAWGQRLASRQAALDLEIGDWLLAAREQRVHERFGFGTMLEYVERRLGYEAHAILERLRVAESLRALPGLRDAVARGECSWSAARELSRVAVPETEAEWLSAAAGKRQREIERLVSGRRPGQSPQAPADPRFVRHILRFEVQGEAYALWREAVRVMRRDVDPQLSEENILAELARRALGGPADEGRSPYQVALSRCEDCDRTFQQARGESVEVSAELMERAHCDGQHLGRVHDASPGGRARATQTIPPAVRRQVIRRDRGRCRVPGCSSSSWLEVHHIQLRSEKGGHDPGNLAVLCGAHHAMLHGGWLLTDGTGASDVRFFHADGTPYGAAAIAEAIDIFAQAFEALREMGFREGETRDAIARVRSHGGPRGLEEVIRAALLEATSPRAA